ncbi:hypothetical protein BSU04_21265 [Caballeronia sordidicola]|uniref:Uncharacterized protein n=1 Tax=Caballeronia sordidicola TaxID=196367 RepID=A0A226X0Z6_CABSO|nr:hypothetical protein BSU04_21265 [Caballeronia sordidicola]
MMVMQATAAKQTVHQRGVAIESVSLVARSSPRNSVRHRGRR